MTPRKTPARVLVLAAAIALSLTVRTGRGATIPVTNLNNSGPGSLRDALNSAATGDMIDCTTLSGVIVLTTGQLSLPKNLTIVGPGPKTLTVSGNGAGRVFSTFSGVTVAISGLTASNGAASGQLGGGIFNDHASLTLSNCAISGNSAQQGAGICNSGGTLTINNCTISSNSAVSIGGGIVNNGGNGGSAALAITNSTLTGNSGSVGGIYNNGANSGNAVLKVFCCTLSGNPGSLASGIFNEAASGSASLETGNTIFNRASAATLGNDAGTITSRGYNLSSDSAGGDGTHGPGGFLNATGDQRNTNPLLDPAGLRDNGGQTLTIALLTGSLAIDAGKSFGSSGDQRGSARPFDILTISNASGGDGSDIGAFELVPPPSLSVSILGNSVVVSWPSASAGFGLQQNGNLADQNGWSAFGGVISDDGTTKSVTVSPPVGTLFFRLKR